MPEEQAFCVLVKLMFDYGMRDLFKQGFEILHLKFYQLERLIQVRDTHTISNLHYLALPMLRLLSSKAQLPKDFWKSSKLCYVGIHWIAFPKYSQMSTQVPRFRLFSGFLHHFVWAKLATSSMRVK